MQKLESDLQIVCVEWFNYQYKNKIIMAIPNGGKRNKIEAIRLKKEGVLAGVADLFIPCIFLFIEMKIGKNKQTQNQKDFQINIKKQNELYDYVLCYSFDEFVDIIKKRM